MEGMLIGEKNKMEAKENREFQEMEEEGIIVKS